MKKVVILFGGVSPEHEVSLSSSYEVMNAIDRTKFEVVEMGIMKTGKWVVGEGSWAHLMRDADSSKFPANLRTLSGDLPPFKGIISKGKLPEANFFDGVDLVFPLMHGPNAEDGRVQGIFELLEIPMVGCGSLSSAICMHKTTTKAVLEAHGIPVTPGIEIYRSDLSSNFVEKVYSKLGKGRVFVKPVSGGSSIGVSRVDNENDLEKAIKLALDYDSVALVEKFIDHRELMVAVMGPFSDGRLVMSPVGEVIPSQEVYDYADKYVLGTEIQKCPTDVPENVANEVLLIVERAYRALQCKGFSRVDCFFDKSTGKVLINEVNTIPGFTGMSHFPKFMRVVGYPMKELITELISLAS